MLFICRLGTFVNCVRECSQSAQNLLDIIVSNFSHFKDETKYGDTDGKRDVKRRHVLRAFEMLIRNTSDCSVFV